MNHGKLRFGILGAANIARKNWKAIQCSGNATVAAVASRDLGRAQQFINECQAQAALDAPPRACGSYEDLLNSNDVDAVYVPLPTGVRKEWVIRAANAGKHIICEKPCAPDVADLEEMLDACRRNHVQFMDGVMFMHSQRLEELKRVLQDGQSVGQLQRVSSAFTFGSAPEFFSANIRTHSLLEPLGCLGDLGWYCIRLSLWAAGWQMPVQVIGRTHAHVNREGSPTPVPTDFSGELIFEQGLSAGFYCSFLADNQQWAILSGSRGYLQVDDFVLPYHGAELSFTAHHTRFNPSGCDFRMEPNPTSHRLPEFSHGHATAQEANMFRNFSAAVRSGSLNPHWPEIALKTQKATSACFESARQHSRLVTV